MARAAYTLLMAEDSTDDVALLTRALRESIELRLVCVLSDGDQVVDYFEGKGRYRDRRAFPIPDVLLLDLRMPKRSGFEVIEYLRARKLPLPKRIVVLTSLAHPSDILRAHELGAHFIANKQADFRPVIERLHRSLGLEERAQA
jgi:CheY-like chemotaxis protein